jgi:hypothetical protein
LTGPRLSFLTCAALTVVAVGCGQRERVPPYVFPLLPTGPFTGEAPANLRQDGGYFLAADKTAWAVQVSWDAVQGAGSYRIEVGDSPGGNNVYAAEFGARFRQIIYKLPFLGNTFVRVRARSGATEGQPSAELMIPSADLRDFIEAMFFGTGAMGLNTGTTCPGPTGDVMRGWPRGQTVQVVFGSGLAGSQLATVQRMVTQFADVSGVSISVQNSSELTPPPLVNRVVVASAPDDEFARACPFIEAPEVCFTNLSFSPFFVMRMLFRGSLTGHRLGMFLGWTFGLCGVGIPGWSVMSGFGDLPSEFTEADLRALSAVYGAGFGQGTPRSAFVAAGLIRP